VRPLSLVALLLGLLIWYLENEICPINLGF
jgi:hypothetical protein